MLPSRISLVVSTKSGIPGERELDSSPVSGAHGAGNDDHMAEKLKASDAREPVASNELFVLDVRGQDDWLADSERVPGSFHIPADELDSRIDELPEDQRILVVSEDGDQAAEVAERLEQQGREAVSLEGGIGGWVQERLLTQPSPDADPRKGEGEEPVEKPEDSDRDEAESD
jgi:rhodanese-related sulfurtransferase